MLLFKPEHVQPILEGRKTQTRRLWPHGCRVKVGSVHQARTRMLDKGSTFAHLLILDVWQEHLMSISDPDAQREGYKTPNDYRNAFWRINHMNPGSDPLIWVVEFKKEM